MRAMLLKDFYILKSTGKSYLLVVGLFVVLVLTGIYDITFFNAMFVMLLTMMPVTAFAYDEQAGWNKYAVATPAGRAGVVRGKYLCSLILWVLSAFLILIFTVVSWMLHPEKYVLNEALLTGSVVVSMGLLLVDFLLPLIFKFGAQKSRAMLMVVVGVLVAAGVVLSMTMEGSGISASVQLIAVLAPVVALGGCAISYFTSMSIFGKKEL